MSEEEQREAQKGFNVADKRRFESDGSARAQAEGASDRPRDTDADGGELPALDFSTFVLSLSTSAMVHLGEAPHPDGQSRKDLVLAKQTIDIIGMLKAKTEGNLNDEESRLLSELLYDLRLRYVAAAR